MFTAMTEMHKKAKGFHMTFDNGITVSVQWGKMNYCDNRSYGSVRDEDTPPCVNAEAALFYADGGAWVKGWPHKNERDDAQGYLTPAQVLEIMNWAIAQPKQEKVES
jgi:hypothetical protein